MPRPMVMAIIISIKVNPACWQGGRGRMRLSAGVGVIMASVEDGPDRGIRKLLTGTGGIAAKVGVGAGRSVVGIGAPIHPTHGDGVAAGVARDRLHHRP